MNATSILLVEDHEGFAKALLNMLSQNPNLQVVAVANGAITSSSNNNASNNGSTTIITKVLWLPSLIMLPLLLVSFWLGRKHALLALRKHLERASRS